MTEMAGAPAESAAAARSSTNTPKIGRTDELRDVLERDRRQGTERIIELGRWFVLVFAAVTANFPGQPSQGRAEIDLILGGWALFNLAQTLALVAHTIPNAWMRYGMTAVDIIVATALVYLTGGFSSNFGITFYVVIIASSLRYSLVGSLVNATIISLLYLGSGLADGGTLSAATGDSFASHLFLYFVVALTTGLLSREMIRAREKQLTHTFELEHSAILERQDVDRVKSDFMMLASHELRTPLTKIKAWLTLMHEAGDKLPEDARAEGFAELRQETEHLARLTENLLSIAQLESGEIRIKSSAVSLDDIFTDVLSRFVETTDRSRFLCKVDDKAQHVLADPDRLALVLSCLVDNAIKFSPETEPVEMAATKVGSKVQIAISDHGRRIPDNQVERVFASFYQVESPLVRQREGFGVGLYLARQLIERMGGDIWIDNAHVRGNTFIIALPGHV